MYSCNSYSFLYTSQIQISSVSTLTKKITMTTIKYILEKTRDNLATGSFLQVIKIRKLIPDFPGNCSHLVFRVYLRDLNRTMTVLVPQRVHTYIII